MVDGASGGVPARDAFDEWLDASSKGFQQPDEDRDATASRDEDLDDAPREPDIELPPDGAAPRLCGRRWPAEAEPPEGLPPVTARRPRGPVALPGWPGARGVGRCGEIAVVETEVSTMSRLGRPFTRPSSPFMAMDACFQSLLGPPGTCAIVVFRAEAPVSPWRRVCPAADR